MVAGPACEDGAMQTGTPTCGTPPAVSFRAASLDDVPEVLALVQSSYRGEDSRAGWTTEADLLDGQRTDRAAVEEVVGSDAGMILLAEAADGRLLGCCQLERQADAAYFGMFAIRPALQGRGLGGLLLAEAERHVRDTWCARRLEMQVIAVREDLIAWYARRGYLATGESRPFPYGDERFGLPRRPDLSFAVLVKDLAADR
jgi:GNAT superfamily N-acetyltransferase